MAKNTPPGPSVDASGQSTIDPSDNTRALNEASSRRHDDMAGLRAEMGRAENKALRREMHLRSRYEEKLSQAESARLDAIRQRDNEQVANAAEVQRQVATTLAATVDRSAEAMRSSLSQAEQRNAATLDAKLQPISSAIGDLQRFQFESGGAKAQNVETRQDQRGSSGLAWVIIGIAVTAFLTISGFFLTVTIAAVGFFLASR